MSENIDIKIREDGSRVVSRSLDGIAAKAEVVEKSVKSMNKTLDDSAKSGTSLDRLKGMINDIDSFNSTMVDRFGKNLTQYRTTLMKHFDMVSNQAKASAANIKKQMEVLTATPQGIGELNDFYRQQGEAHIAAIVKEMAAAEAVENASYDRRLAAALKNIAAREKFEQSYTSFWATELAARDALEQKSIVASVRNLTVSEEAEQKSSADRLKTTLTTLKAKESAENAYTAMFAGLLKAREDMEQASIIASVKNLKAIEIADEKSNASRLKNALDAIKARQTAEEAYTAFWIIELKKRDAAQAASNLKSAQQRSNMQTMNVERLDRTIIAPQNNQSALYAKDDISRNVGGKSSLQLAEMQAMQRQMAMMSLMLPMIEREISLGKEVELTDKRQIENKKLLTKGNQDLAESSSKAANNQHIWNNAGKEGHAVARGLSGSLGTLWLTYGSLAPLLAGAAIGSAFVGVAKAGSEMAYQLAFVKALGNESTEAIGKLNDQAVKLSREGAYGPKEIASGYRILAQAGKDAAESLKIMPDVLNLATTGELSMEQAGIAVVGTLNAFDLGIEKSAHVSDLFAKAAAVSQSSVQDLTQAMRYASTVGTQYKQNVEETMAALALLAKVNITGTSAGTSYRNMLKELFTPTQAVAKELDKLGISMQKTVEQADGSKIQKVKSFVEIINELRKKMDKLDEPSQMLLKGFLGGERGSKEMVAMLELTEKEWTDFYERIGIKSEGFAKKVADDINNTAKNEWKQALNTLEAEFTQAFKAMEPEFIAFAQQLKTIFQSEEFKTTIKSIAETVLSIGKVFLDLAPILYDLAKAWLVLKAAQLGAAAASGLAAVATSAQALAGGMLAASGAIGPVARGVTMLTPLLSAMGGPLTIILGLLAAGAAAWFLWGKEAETASGKAIKSTEARLKQLKESAKFGEGELGDARKELDARETRLSHMVAAGQGGDNLKEARKALEIQQQLVDVLEQREYAAINAVKAETPKTVTPPRTGTETWKPPVTTTGGAGPSGRLNKDDDALAKLKARLEVSKQEYEQIQLYGQARFELNEGQKKALEIQEKMTALEKMSTAELLEKGIKGRAAQLQSFKEQLVVATELGEQLKKNALARVDTSLQEESRLVRLLPEKRDEENKFLVFRNQLLKEGIPLEQIDLDKLREKVAAQAELNRLMAIRDNVVSNSAGETLKNTNRDIAGIQEAGNIPGITEQDKNAATMGKMSALGLDMSQTQEFISAQEQQFMLLRAQTDAYYQAGLIGEETYRMAKAQIQLKYEQIELSQASQFFNGLAGLANSGNRKLAAVGKAAAVTEATIQGYVQVSKALASSPPPMNYALAAAAAVSAAMQVSKIMSVNTAFATGGSFMVGGSGGVDSQNVAFRASPGEKVTVSTPTQVRKGDELNKGSEGQNSKPINQRIINIIDPAMLSDYLSTPEGEQVLVNTIRRNSSSIGQALNG
jgi:TP901 family phage tail tape measure protein